MDKFCSAGIAKKLLPFARMKGGPDFALPPMCGRLAFQLMALVLQFEQMQQIIQPDDIEVLDSHLIARVSEFRRAAFANAGNGHPLPETAYVLQDGLEILIANQRNGDVIGIGNGGEVEHRRRQSDVHAFFFWFKRVLRVAVGSSQTPSTEVDGKDLEFVVVFLFK